jgi:hypothetical protein
MVERQGRNRYSIGSKEKGQINIPYRPNKRKQQALHIIQRKQSKKYSPYCPKKEEEQTLEMVQTKRRNIDSSARNTGHGRNSGPPINLTPEKICLEPKTGASAQ